MHTASFLSKTHWLIPSKLAGMPQPTPTDFEQMQRARVTLLVSLTQEWHPPETILARLGIASLHVPILDFKAPSVAQAIEVCNAIDQTNTSVLHCHAGKGRTGTLLAAYLIWQGLGGAESIKKCREINPSWIETSGQMDFLIEFTQHLRSRK